MTRYFSTSKVIPCDGSSLRMGSHASGETKPVQSYCPFRNLYCAFEERAKYHREILWRMKIPIEGMRPALVSEESYRRLDALRAFRHFFRHAYSYELDPKKVSLVVEDALALETCYRDELDHFLDQIEG